MTRIIIDTTHTAKTGLNTGIQRVVGRVTECSKTLQDQLGVECIPVQCHGGRVISVPRIAGVRSWDERLFDGIRDGGSSLARSIGTRASACSPTITRNLQRLGTRCRKTLYPRSLVRSATFAVARLRGREVKLQASDIVLMLDTSWGTSPVLYELARKHGCYIAQVVYDLLPVTHPQFFSPKIVPCFGQWLEYALARVDGLWAISQTVRDELYDYYRQRCAVDPNLAAAVPRLAADKFRSFRLGADLMSTDQQRLPRESIRAIFGAAEPVFLSVGTIEPRKNHAWLISAFDRYWEKGGQAKLVLVGRAGWDCDAIEQRIERHGVYGTRLFWLKDADDDEVQYMYRHARAMLYGSLAEGFGLPIIEALHQGTDVLASDTPIHREVGGKNVTYFALDLLEDLVQKIHTFADSPKPAPTDRLPSAPTWNTCADQLLGDVLSVARLGHTPLGHTPLVTTARSDKAA